MPLRSATSDRSLLLVEVQDDFAVGVRPELVAAPFEIGAQLAMVVDLTVEDQGQRLILVGERRLAAGRRPRQ